MTTSFNDSPIDDFDDDMFGVGTFARSLADSLAQIQNPVGTTVALHGPWGSGKSSVVNLVRRALAERDDEKLVVSEFKPWWFRGEEALALAFFQHLDAILEKGLGDKVIGLVSNIAKPVLQAGSVLGAAAALATGAPVAGIADKASSYLSSFFDGGRTVEEAFEAISKVLGSQEKRFVIIIDDIDRLDPEEQLAIFRLIKSVGYLPNVLYLLVFDRDLAERLVAERYPSEGPHYLEKIVQMSFDLPAPIKHDLDQAVLSVVDQVCGTPPDRDDQLRFMNVFYDAVSPYVTLPRDVMRLRNAITVTWPAIREEVRVADFVALEMIRLSEPKLHKAIRVHRDKICGARGDRAHQDEIGQQRFDRLLGEVREERRDIAKIAVERLFPRLREMSYGQDFIADWDADRRVCVEHHFDTYYRLSLSDETLPKTVLDELIERAGEPAFIRERFREAAKVTRRNGSSMVPVYLDALNVRWRDLTLRSIQPLLATLFEIHDSIALKRDADRGIFRFGNTSLRYHWLIRRLLYDRFSLVERSAMLVSAVNDASLGWRVNFVSSMMDDYEPREGRRRTEEDKCLIVQGELQTLIDAALAAIRTASKDGTLLGHADLPNILYRWREFARDNGKEVREWTDSLISEDQALVRIANTFTRESWSASGTDRVSIRNAEAEIQPEIFGNPDLLRRNLERLRDGGKLSATDQKVVVNFLDAWSAPGDDAPG